MALFDEEELELTPEEQAMMVPPVPEQVVAPQPEIDPMLVAAQQERDRRQQMGMLLAGFQQLAQAGGRAAGGNFTSDMSVAKGLMDTSGQPLEDYKTQKELEKAKKASERQAKLDTQGEEKHKAIMEEYSNKLKKSNLDISNEEKIADPTSAESQMAQEFYMKIDPKANPETVKQQSAKTLFQISKPMQELVVQKLKTDAMSKQLELSARRVEQGDRRLDLGETAEKRLTKRQSWLEKEKDEPSDKQVEQIAGYDEAEKLLEQAKNLKTSGKVDTGVFKSIENWGREQIGKQDISTAELKMLTGEAIAQKIKAMSGTAASDKEREFLQSITLPTLKDDDEVFEAKLNQALKTIQQAKQIRLDVMRKQGKNPSGFEDTVTLQAPDGSIQKVKKSAAQKYIDKGAKVVPQ